MSRPGCFNLRVLNRKQEVTCVMKRSIQASKLIRTRLRTNRSLTSGWMERRKVSMAASDKNSPVLKTGEEWKKKQTN